MAKKIKGGSVEFEVTDGGSLKKLEKNSKRAGDALGSVARNAQEADRRLKGTAQMSGNSTKNFAKQAQSISGGLVPAYATLAAQVFAVSAAFEFLKSAFNTRNLIEGQKAFSAATGVAYRSLTKDIKAATQGMLSFEEAAQAAAIGTAAGLTRGQLTAIGKAATDVSLALGRDLTDSFNRLTRGITKAEPELLDELGIVLRLDPAMKNYATSVGKAVSDLTQFERSQAIANEVLGQAETKFGAIQKIMDPSAFALGQFSAAFNDLMVEFKVGLVEFLTPTIKFLSNNVEALTGALALGLAPVLRSILPDFKAMGAQAELSLGKLRAARDLATAEAGLFAQRASVASGKGRAGLIKTGQSQAKSLGIGLKGEGSETLSKRQLSIYKKQLLDQELLDKKYNAKKQAMFREFLINQEALLTKAYGKEEGLRKKNEFEERASLARREAAHKAFFMRMTKVVGGFARAANLALSAIGWLGLVALIASAGKATYDFFNPPDAETTKLKERLDQIKQTAQDLTEDLKRMREVQGAGLLGMTGVTEQRGQAAASADILNTLANFNTAIKAGDKQGALNVVKSVMALNDVLGQNIVNEKELINAVRNGTTISQAQMQAANGLAQKYIIAGQATKQFAQDQQALNNALRSAVNVSMPMSNLATSFSGAMNSLRASIAADPQSLGIVRENIASSQQRIASMRKNMFGTGVVDRVLNKRRYDAIKAAGGPRNDDDREFISGFNKRMRALQEEIKAQKYLQQSEEQQTEAAKNRQKLLENYEKNYAGILRIQEKSFNIEMDKLGLERDRMALPLNNEVGTKNAREDLKIDEQKLKFREAQLAKETAFRNLQINKDTTNEQELENLRQIYNLALERLKVEGDRSLLVDRQVQKQKLLNNLADTELQTQRAISRAKLGLAVARGQDALTRGATGTRAGLQRLAEQEIQYQRREVGFVEQQLADNANRIQKLRAEGKDTETEYQNALDARIELTMRLVDTQNKLLQSEQALTSAGFFAQQGIAQQALDTQVNVRRGMGLVGGTSLGGEYEQQALKLLADLNKTDVSQLDQSDREKLKASVNAAVSARIELGMMQETSAAIESSFSGLFDALLDGTKSLKQALGDMMKQLLADLAKAYLKAAALKMLQSAGLGIPGLGARYGGIMSPSGKSFAVGGIASGPQSGYMATLHGREAVIPLGNDRSVPVELKGAGGGGNVVNVSVNVAADGQSSVTTQGDTMQGLGKVIGQAVQQELMRQKRPGGMLSPYGAA